MSRYSKVGTLFAAVAFAAASSSMRISQAWYLRPATFDPTRFSNGVTDTRVLEIRRPDLT